MAPAGPRLVLSEEEIRARSGLAAHRDLAELQSLSIPGTYQEKITHLGNSLMNLTGLKSLDLSRNSLVSLEGIQYLIMLESLNLYYNCISSLAEVFRLHSLTELTDVDFRLNPVVKNESDYRLFVVHMLPKLQQLDDRPVRESERKASRLHFASEDSPDSKPSSPAALKVGRPRRCRATCTDSLSRKCLLLGADDEAVLSLIAECEWDLSDPPGSAGASREHVAESHGSQAESSPLPSPCSVQLQGGDATKRGHGRKKESWKGRYPEKKPQRHHCGDLLPRSGDAPEAGPCPVRPRARRAGARAGSLPVTDSTGAEDTVGSSQNSSLRVLRPRSPVPASEKYRKRRTPGGRSQGPLDLACPSCLGRPNRPPSTGGRSQGAFPHAAAEDQGPRSTSTARELSPSPPSAAPPGTKAVLEEAFLEALLDLAGRHGDARRPLQGTEAFLAQARRILSSVQAFTATQDSSAVDEEISSLTLENKSLQNHLAEQQRQHNAKLSELMAELGTARKELGDSKKRLDRSLEENSSLKSLLFSMKKEVKNADASATLTLQISGLQAAVTQLLGEVAELKQHLERSDKIQELTQMLQESHSSLVSTNEHLLQELGQARARHRAEVEQLHWSYKELKKTLALFPRSSPDPSAR